MNLFHYYCSISDDVSIFLLLDISLPVLDITLNVLLVEEEVYDVLESAHPNGVVHDDEKMARPVELDL